MKPRGLKDQVIALIKDGKNYPEIMEIIGCSKATIHHHLKKNNLTIHIRPKQSHRLGTTIEKIRETRHKNLFTEPFENLGKRRKKQKILFEQNGICKNCSNPPIWLEKPIAFELDHIDGNPLNNCRDNLRMLCPNCHSQTPTFRGRVVQLERTLSS